MIMNEIIEKSIQEVLDGNANAYRDVVTACEAKIRVILAAMLPDRQSVEDLAQEVFIKAYQKLSEYEPGTDFVLWIKQIARNMAMNERRSWVRRHSFKSHYKVHVEQVVEPQLESICEGVDGDVLTGVQECIDALKGNARKVVQNFYFDNCSTEQIARENKKKNSWVRTVLHRSRLALAECLRKRGVTDYA
jgi:RNA polymerase sigma-70 factor (ECF subfamily)